MYIESVKLHSFIEVEGCEDRVITLVGFGFSRETALEIDRVLPKEIDVKTLEHLRELYDSNIFDELHVITKREIKRLLL